MKIKHKKKTYEYPTSTMVVNTDTRDRIKICAAKEKVSMMTFIEKLITDYENKSH